MVMEDFYRAQRRRFGYLMDGDQPAGGVWNLDHENRKPLPEATTPWPDAACSTHSTTSTATVIAGRRPPTSRERTRSVGGPRRARRRSCSSTT